MIPACRPPQRESGRLIRWAYPGCEQNDSHRAAKRLAEASSQCKGAPCLTQGVFHANAPCPGPNEAYRIRIR
jgi:hypothetical protein